MEKTQSTEKTSKEGIMNEGGNQLNKINKKTEKNETNEKHHEKKDKVFKIELNDLHLLVEQGIIDKDLADKISKDGQISEQEQHDIIKNEHSEKILTIFEEMEKNETIKEIIPEEMRVSKEEFTRAMNNEQTKQEVLKKFDSSLDIVYQHINGVSPYKKNMFGKYVNLLSNKLIIPLQENIIDLKNLLDK